MLVRSLPILLPGMFNVFLSSLNETVNFRHFVALDCLTGNHTNQSEVFHYG